MTLSHAIATILLQAPHTGYDVGKEFDEKVSCYWQATSQQIYRELAKMQDKGLVEVENVPQLNRPDKKLYSLTESGKQELMEWITEPSEPTAIRESLLVKVRAGYIVPDEVLIEEIKRRKKLHQQKLAHYHSVEAEINTAELTRPQRHMYLTLRCGIRYETSWIEWCDEAIEQLQQE